MNRLQLPTSYELIPSVVLQTSERSIAERKIAILERALTYHPASEELLLELLEAVESIEDSSKVMERWEGVLQQHGGNPKLWLGYLRWSKLQFPSFSVPKAQRMYDRALEVSLAIANNLTASAWSPYCGQHWLAALTVEFCEWSPVFSVIAILWSEKQCFQGMHSLP